MELNFYVVNGNDVVVIAQFSRDSPIYDWFEREAAEDPLEITSEMVEDGIYWLYDEKEWQEARATYYKKRAQAPWLRKDDKERVRLGKIAREAEDTASELSKSLEFSKSMHIMLDTVDAMYCGISTSKTKVLEKYRNENLKLS